MQDKRIKNISPVDIFDKTSALAACSIFCMPSAQESFGGVYVEAWSMKKPVIGGRTPQISCVIDNNLNGLLTHQDKEELSDKISYLLSNPDQSKKMGKQGWQKVQNCYTWDKIAKKTLSVYKGLL